MIDLDVRKKFHIKLLSETHVAFKIQAFRLKLSMSTIMQELIDLVVNEDPYIMKILHDLKKRRISREVRQLSNTDADSILNYIEEMDEHEN